MSSPNPIPPEASQETPVPTAPAESRPRRPRRPRLFTEPDPSSNPLAAENRPQPAPDLDVGAGPGSPEGPSPGKQGSPGPSRASAPKSPFTRAELRRAIDGAVTGASLLAHEQLARDEIDEELERWIASDEESAGLAEPLSGLASRRMNGPAGMLNPDVVDLVNALVVIAAYAARQLKLRSTARQLRRRTEPIANESPLVDEPGQPSPA